MYALSKVTKNVKIWKLVSLLFALVCSTTAHSWMSCPPSFVTSLGRGGHTSSLCEGNGDSAFITNVEAGDRLKVGWISNNHAGGYVRISLVPFGEHLDENTAKINVLKFACYGHDTRPNKLSRSKYGDCIHPCNARGGCEYQSTIADSDRYDTTIGIPTNLPDGYYVLQTALLVGNGGTPYYSCAKLYISGGDTSFTNCLSNAEPITYTCLKTGGPVLATNFLREGAKSGEFCFHLNGDRGTVDDTIRDVPINVECDPRMTCGNSVQPEQCKKNVPEMLDITSRGGHFVQPYCFVYNTLPPLPPTCFDGKQNGDEDGVDCGGSACKHNICPTPPPAESVYYDYITQSGGTWDSGSTVNFFVKITKSMPELSCWRLTVQFNCPLKVLYSWNQAKEVVVNGNGDNILTFEQDPASLSVPTVTSDLRVSFSANNPCFGKSSFIGKNGQIQACDEMCSFWDSSIIKFNFGLLTVYEDENECFYQKIRPID